MGDKGEVKVSPRKLGIPGRGNRVAEACRWGPGRGMS